MEKVDDSDGEKKKRWEWVGGTVYKYPWRRSESTGHYSDKNIETQEVTAEFRRSWLSM